MLPAYRDPVARMHGLAYHHPIRCWPGPRRISQDQVHGYPRDLGKHLKPGPGQERMHLRIDPDQGRGQFGREGRIPTLQI